MSEARPVGFMCSTTTCPAVGTWVDVDAAAVAFAAAEHIPVTCRGCRKPLALIPRRHPATTSRGAIR